MYFYLVNGLPAASLLPELPFSAGSDNITPQLFLLRREPGSSPAAFRVTDPRQLTAETVDISWLDPSRLGPIPSLPANVLDSIRQGTLTAVNLSHPLWKDSLCRLQSPPRKKRIHLLAVGDVGGTLLTALKLLGSDCISVIGIQDLRENTIQRWVKEMGQISWPDDYQSLPEVEAITPDQLFNCDIFLFAAAKFIPPVGSDTQDVRMAQLAANRPLAENFAKQARAAHFQGLFIVLSDPVDPLCRAVWKASNQNEVGEIDFLGLLPEQIQGFGLGVMNARAAYFAKQDSRFCDFLIDGRTFGPHGHGLVVANSIIHYDDSLSKELTQLTETANLQIRELGFKPYVAPAVSSGAIQLLLTLRGQWHCSSVNLGGIWVGLRNRFTSQGLEIETHSLPDALFYRLLKTEKILRNIS